MQNRACIRNICAWPMLGLPELAVLFQSKTIGENMDCDSLLCSAAASAAPCMLTLIWSWS